MHGLGPFAWMGTVISTIKSLLPAAGLTLVSLLLLGIFTLRAPLEPGQPVAILFPPGQPLAQSVRAIAAANGTPIRVGRWDNLVIAVFDRPGPDGDLAGSLSASGALLVFDALIAAACGFDPAAGDKA